MSWKTHKPEHFGIYLCTVAYWSTEYKEWRTQVNTQLYDQKQDTWYLKEPHFVVAWDVLPQKYDGPVEPLTETGSRAA